MGMHAYNLKSANYEFMSSFHTILLISFTTHDLGCKDVVRLSWCPIYALVVS